MRTRTKTRIADRNAASRRIDRSCNGGMPDGRSLLSPVELRRLKNLFFIARTIVEGCYAGRHRSRFRGHGADFADYREYAPGDDISDLDWKAYGRTDRLFIRQFEAQTDMTVYAMLDCSASMSYAGLDPAHSLSKHQYACYLLAALAYLTIRQGDRISLGLFGDKLDYLSSTGSTYGHLYNLLNRMEATRPHGQTDVESALRQAFAGMKHRGLLVLVSDLLGDPSTLFNALNLYRHRRFDVIVFQILHEDELNLPDTPNARFIDSETNQTLTTSVTEIREEYRQRLNRHLDALRTGCAARRIDYNLTTTATDFHHILERYLLERATASV